jgi:opacity protein-like surface antigen
MQRAFLLIGAAALACAAANAQTDVALSVYGAFNGTTTNGNFTVQSPANAAGALLEVRHISKPWLGYEGTYAFNRANQSYSDIFKCPGTECSYTYAGSVSANAHEVTVDYVASMKIKLTSFRPFALAGGGLLLDVPKGSQVTTCGIFSTTCQTFSGGIKNTTIKPVFVYGAGVDWGLLPHIGLRLQYRGNLYKAPDLTNLFTSSSAFTHTAEPMIGVYFRL